MILIGCSGWNYPEWNKNFYPGSARDQLKYYSEVFDTVEVNSTFYREFNQRSLRSWIAKVRGNPRFRFTLKVPQKISHEDMLSSTSAAISDLEKFMQEEAMPFRDADSLGAILLQLPGFFSRDNTGRLIDVLSSVDRKGFNFFVEFRKRDLYNDMGLRRNLNSINVGVVHLDSPDILLDEFLEDDFRNVYYRFHGRNRKEWFSPVRSDQSKYNYNYSILELESLSSAIKKSMELKDEIFVYFNNHPNGNAPMNAMDMLNILGIGARSGGRLAV